MTVVIRQKSGKIENTEVDLDMLFSNNNGDDVDRTQLSHGSHGNKINRKKDNRKSNKKSKDSGQNISK